jgi:lipoprotein-releasing system permease protein
MRAATLIVAVAAFNIVSTLVMTVTDKQSDIAILRTLGLTPGGVMAVFLVQGCIIGLVGTVLGVGGGIALSLNVGEIMPALENLFGINLLPADIYYISDLPSDLQVSDVVRIVLLAAGLSVLATLYPAWRASRTRPAEALRHE